MVAFIQKGKIELSEFFKDKVQEQIENNINVVAQCMYYVGNSVKEVFPTIREFKMLVSKSPMDKNFIDKINTWKTKYFENLKSISNKKDLKRVRKESFEKLSSDFLQQLRNILYKTFPLKNMTKNAQTMIVYLRTLMHYVRSLWLLDNTTIYKSSNETTMIDQNTTIYERSNEATMIDQLFSSYHITSLFNLQYYNEFKEVLHLWNESSTNHFANQSGDKYEDVSEKTEGSFEIFPIWNKKLDNGKQTLRNMREQLQFHFEMLTFPEMLHFVLISFINEEVPLQLEHENAWTPIDVIDSSFLIEWSSSQISRYVNYLTLFIKNKAELQNFESIMDRINRIPQIDEFQEFRGILEDCSKHLRQLFVKNENIANELSKIWDISYHYFGDDFGDDSLSPKYGIGSIKPLRTPTANYDNIRAPRLQKDKVLRDMISRILSRNYVYGSDWVKSKLILDNYQYFGGNMQLIILELISFKMKCYSDETNYNFKTFMSHLTQIQQKYNSIASKFKGLASTALPHSAISHELRSKNVNTKNVHVQNNSSWRKVHEDAYNIFYHFDENENSFFGAVPHTACPNTLQPNNGNLEVFFGYAFHVITCISRFVHAFTTTENETTYSSKWNITNLFVENYGHICSQIKANKDDASFNEDRKRRLHENSRHIIASDFKCFELALRDLYKHPRLLNLLYLLKDRDEVIIQNAAKFVYGETIENKEYKKIHIYVQDQWHNGIFDLHQERNFPSISLKSDELVPDDPIKNVVTLYTKIAESFHDYVNRDSFLSEKSGKSDLMARVRNEKVLAIQKFCNLYFNPTIVDEFTRNVTKYVNTGMKNNEMKLQDKFTESMNSKGKSDKFSTLLQFGTDFYNTLQRQTFDDANIESYTYRKSLILYCQYIQQLLNSTTPQNYEDYLKRTKQLQQHAIELLPPQNAWRKPA